MPQPFVEIEGDSEELSPSAYVQVARLAWPVSFDNSIVHGVSEWRWVKKIGAEDNSEYYSARKYNKSIKLVSKR